MNNNAPDFKKVQKLARWFNAKPIFFDWDIKKNKAILRPYNKKKDILALTYIAGIPYEKAQDLYELKFKKIENNVFRYNKSTLVLDTEGNPLMQIVATEDDIVSRSEYSESKCMLIKCPEQRVHEFIELIKQEKCKSFCLGI